MHVGICDDCKEAREFLLEILKGCAEVRLVSAFSEGGALLEATEDGVVFNLVFMDIDMPGMDGLTVGKRVKALSPSTALVFVTGYPQYALDAFECEAFHYLLKPVDAKKVKDVIRRLCERLTEKERFYVIKNRNEAIRISLSGLYYVECCGRHVVFHTEKGSYETVGRLKEVYEELKPCGFYQIHQGYLVNMDKISHFKGYDVILENGSPVPMSVRKRGEVLAAYARYIEVH